VAVKRAQCSIPPRKRFLPFPLSYQPIFVHPHSLVIAMFKILRRISSFTYPRLDRPWSDDATSNAPTIGRKRKMCDEDGDMQESGSTRKRRGQLEHEDTSELGELGVKGSKGNEADPGVKEVTRGAKVVELEDEKQGSRTDGARDNAIEDASETVDGESSVTAPLDPAHAPHNDDHPSQDVTTTDDEAPAGQSETIAEAPSNDPPEVKAPTLTDAGKPSLTQEEREEGLPGTTPEAKSKETANVRKSVEPSRDP